MQYVAIWYVSIGYEDEGRTAKEAVLPASSSSQYLFAYRPLVVRKEQYSLPLFKYNCT